MCQAKDCGKPPSNIWYKDCDVGELEVVISDRKASACIWQIIRAQTEPQPGMLLDVDRVRAGKLVKDHLGGGSNEVAFTVVMVSCIICVPWL